MEHILDKSLDDIIDKSFDVLLKSRSRHAARGEVRAEKKPPRDRVSTDRGKRERAPTPLASRREGGKGRRREGGKGNGPNSPGVSAEQERGTYALGSAPGTQPKKQARPKKTIKTWRPVVVTPRVSADNQSPHLARGQSGETKTPKGGGRDVSGDRRSLWNIISLVGQARQPRGSRPTSCVPDRQRQTDLTIIGIMRGTAVAETVATTVASKAVAGSETAGDTTAWITAVFIIRTPGQVGAAATAAAKAGVATAAAAEVAVATVAVAMAAVATIPAALTFTVQPIRPHPLVP